ncbi:MAG: hypothetical protein QGG84_01880 [Rhodospirillales bacterium]|nr:hypothetical protein [Rhodospirillales bacterium]
MMAGKALLPGTQPFHDKHCDLLLKDIIILVCNPDLFRQVKQASVD